MIGPTCIRLLGPIDVTLDGVLQPMSGLRRKAVLAALALNSGRVVTSDQLIDAVWAGEPPATVVNALQSHVSYLRRALGSPTAIVNQPSGYLLDLPDGATDAATAEHLILAGQQASDPARGAEQLRTALALWRGRSLAELGDLVWFADRAAHLEQLRLAATRSLIDLRLALGEHTEVVPELERLARERPLDEQIHRQLIIALYRSGRQADALGTYQRLRHHLNEDLGIEPNPDLRELETAVLRQDSSLGMVAPTSYTTELATPAPAPTVPRELPADVPGFTGRRAELDKLSSLICSQAPTAAVVVVLCGSGGTGKTALAVHYGRQVVERFPDGQLYVDLRGAAADEPLPAEAALGALLDSLGVPETRAPAGVPARSARLRSLLAGRRMLLVLDNAFSAEQVRPLLPGTAACPVIVTSRDTLSGLVARDGAVRLTIDVLGRPDAVQLLRTLVGQRAVAEPVAAEALAEQCARLPLALRIAAELAASRANLTLADLVAELDDRSRRLDVLDAGADQGTAVRAVLSWSQRHLPAAAARLFWLLGLHPGREVDAAAAAALAGTGEADADRLLSLLGRGHLVERAGADRWTMHDLLRVYARDLAGERLSAQDRAEALDRLYAAYLATASAGMAAAFPTVRLPPGADSTRGARTFADPATARQWLDTERDNLVAAVRAAEGELVNTAVRLALTIARYLHVGYYNEDALTIQRRALELAAGGDPAVEAGVRYELGRTESRAGNYPAAIGHYTEALRRYRAAGDLNGQAACTNGLGTMAQQLGRYPAAMGHYKAARELFRQAANPVGEAGTLANLAQVLWYRGEHAESVRQHQLTIEMFRATGDRIGEGRAHNDIGTVCQRQREYRTAQRHHEQARRILRAAGDRAGEACAVTDLGRIHSLSGRHTEAFKYHNRALETFREIGDQVGEAEVLLDLGEANRRAGRFSEALSHHQRGHRLAGRVGHRRLQAIALNGQGRALLALHRPADALTAHSSALDLAVSLEDRDLRAAALVGMGDALDAVGQPGRARRHWQKAQAIYAELNVPEADELRRHA